MDEMVLKGQRWVNATYQGRAGYSPSPETGRTGWSTMFSLTRALQIELGLSTPSDSFGDATMKALTAFGNVSYKTSNRNIKTIAEAALYCKGYSGGSLDGTFTTQTETGILTMLANMGMPPGDGPLSVVVTPKMFKAMLNMDAYVPLPGGTDRIRTVQQELNRNYTSRPQFLFGPCDGLFSRNLQKALVYALQFEMGLDSSKIDGLMGPTTIAGLKTKGLVGLGSKDAGESGFVRLFNAALACNRYAGATGAAASTFTSATVFTTKAFQEFCRLPKTGKADYATWMALLVSTGDPDRPTTAFDCKLPLNAARIATVKAAGYKIVGRYISGGTTKIITSSEIALIQDNGMAFFPIWQEANNGVTSFSYAQGQAAGTAACASARSLGLPKGTAIYFAVDFDPQDSEITAAVIPHFRGVMDSVKRDGSYYAVGAYGTRNVCGRLSDAGLSSMSFVSGMSTGYSGNLGYRLPDNWAFDQIKNTVLAQGTTGAAEIDKDAVSGLDLGVATVTRPRDRNDPLYTFLAWVEARAQQWQAQGHTSRSVAELTAQYLRFRGGKYDFKYADYIFGVIDKDFVAFAENYAGRPDFCYLWDPRYYQIGDLEHFGASFGAVLNHGMVKPGASGAGDFGGWGGDLLSVLGQFLQTGLDGGEAYAWAKERIGAPTTDTFMTLADYMCDVDAMNMGLDCRADPTLKLSTLFKRDYASPEAASSRFRRFFRQRFSNSVDLAVASARDVCAGGNVDTTMLQAREAFWFSQFSDLSYPSPEFLQVTQAAALKGVTTAFADFVSKLGV